MIEQAIAGKPEKYIYVFERKIYFIFKIFNEVFGTSQNNGSPSIEIARALVLAKITEF